MFGPVYEKARCPGFIARIRRHAVRRCSRSGRERKNTQARADGHSGSDGKPGRYGDASAKETRLFRAPESFPSAREEAESDAYSCPISFAERYSRTIAHARAGEKVIQEAHFQKIHTRARGNANSQTAPQSHTNSGAGRNFHAQTQADAESNARTGNSGRHTH